MPLATAAEPAQGPMRTISDEAFQRWLKEDHQLIEGILTHLKQIDVMLGEIERMIRQIPDSLAKPPAPPKPVIVEKTVVQEVEVPGPYGGWPLTLGATALAALLAFWLGQRRAASRTAVDQPSTPAAQPRAEAGKPVPSPAAPASHTAKRAPAPAAAPTTVATPSAPVAPLPSAPVTPAAPQAAAAAPLTAALEPTPSSEGDQALELAEIMLSMGLGHGASQALIERIRKEPKQALRHWLKLLEIYRRNGQKEEFERAAEELRLHFNVRPEDWQAAPGPTQTLENFPHITKRLTELWGKPDCLVYLQNLLDDNRGGARSGFPQAVAEEILLLISVMREAYGFLPS